MQRGLESRLSVDWQHRRPRHFSRMGRKSALLAKIPGHYVRPLTAAAVIPATDGPSHVFVHNPAPQDSGSPPTPREPAFSIFSSWCALRPTPHVDRLSNCAIVGRIGVQSPRLYRDPTHMTTSLSQFSSRSHSRVAYGSAVARTGTGAFRLHQRLSESSSFTCASNFGKARIGNCWLGRCDQQACRRKLSEPMTTTEGRPPLTHVNAHAMLAAQTPRYLSESADRSTMAGHSIESGHVRGVP